MGGDPTDGPYPGEFPPQGDEKAVRDANAETDGWEMGISPDRSFPSGVRYGLNGDIYIHTP